MEQVHGVDVSWMTQASPKDRINRRPPSPPPAKVASPARPQQINTTPAPSPKPTSGEPQSPGAANNAPSNGHATSPAIPITRRRSRSGSLDRSNPNSPSSTPPSRRNSWFSNISAKFSGSNLHHHYQQQQQQQGQQGQQGQHNHNQPPSPSLSQTQHDPVIESPTEEAADIPAPHVPRPSGARSAVLPPANKPADNGPYTPAPPKSGQAGFLGVFRRLSSSGNGHNARIGHGLVERKILNVDDKRQRCAISELKDSKLRKVSFCVDVEVAPVPKYADAPDAADKTPVDSTHKKMTEKGEGAALKDPKAVEEKKAAEGTPQTPVETVASQPAAAAVPTKVPETNGDAKPGSSDHQLSSSPSDHPSKKKEKKKRSEEERKARKEKKRRLAEANGTIPMEIRYDDSSDASSETHDSHVPPTLTTKAPATNGYPTTDPARVYRRCCQLRETPILKKITEQLLDTNNSSPDTGMVNKLDLTGYWLQHVDIVTLGDYLAVVPVREILMENSNLNDEGLRIILAGLLAVQRPNLSHHGRRRRRAKTRDLEPRGGVVERLVIKNNKFGPDGWKHLSLFLYLCRSLKFLDVSNVPFPRQAAAGGQAARVLPDGRHMPLGIAEIFSRALAERLAGPATLELLNIGGTEPTMDQLGTIVDGLVKSEVRRLGLAQNHLDDKGAEHVGRFLAAGKCQGLDLGGNHIIGSHIEPIFEAVTEKSPLWALSLSDCDIKPGTLCKILHRLANLTNFRFIDLSHNHELFTQSPSAVSTLRRYLPKMEPLKRIHLQDVGMSPEQAIAIVEIVPEARELAHISLLENTQLVKLADARSEEDQEEACALYASLMAAARLSTSLVCVDIDVPSEKSSEVVKAMAKQVVAYCLRNIEAIPDADIGAMVASAISESQGPATAGTVAADHKDASKSPAYPDVIAHLVGHDVLDQDDTDGESAMDGPDEDYVIGGTGVVKALACCLKNRGEDSGRQSVDLGSGASEAGDVDVSTVEARLPTGGKAKEMSKHLLAAARKIRHRVQPALIKARSNASDDQNLRRLVFLDDTLQGIIKRFEDEFPDTREPAAAEASDATTTAPGVVDAASQPLTETAKSSTAATGHDRAEEQLPSVLLPADDAAAASDDAGDDEHKASQGEPGKPLSRSPSVLSKLLAEEEGRTLRTGHRLRSGLFTQADLEFMETVDDIGSDPSLVNLVNDWAEDIGGELLEQVRRKGAINTFKEDRAFVVRCMKEHDADSWGSFVEAQHKARANISAASDKGKDEAVVDE